MPLDIVLKVIANAIRQEKSDVKIGRQGTKSKHNTDQEAREETAIWIVFKEK